MGILSISASRLADSYYDDSGCEFYNPYSRWVTEYKTEVNITASLDPLKKKLGPHFPMPADDIPWSALMAALFEILPIKFSLSEAAIQRIRNNDRHSPSITLVPDSNIARFWAYHIEPQWSVREVLLYAGPTINVP